jgi:heat shock protein HslJ
MASKTLKPMLASLLVLAVTACHGAGPTGPSVLPSGPGIGSGATGSAAASVVKTLFVGPVQLPCAGVGRQMCLQIATAAGGPWTMWYEGIRGFEHEPGLLYELRVREDVVENPPADASSIRLTLLEVVSATPLELAGLIGPVWALRTLDGRPSVPGSPITAEFQDDDKLAGTAGCNRYFGGYWAEAGRLSVSPLATTRMECPLPGVMELEYDYLRALLDAKLYEVRGMELRLTRADGSGELIFDSQAR